MKKLVCALTLLFSACATVPYQPYAREVKKKPRESGVISLKTEHRPEDRARADFLMSSNCGQDQVVQVDEEGEVVIGQKTDTSSNKSQTEQPKDFFSVGGIGFSSGSRPAEVTDTQSQTTQIKEWNIVYHCASAGGGKKTPIRK